MSPEGKPIQVDANALQAAGVQNGIGMIDSVYRYPFKDIKTLNQELSISFDIGYKITLRYILRNRNVQTK